MASYEDYIRSAILSLNVYDIRSVDEIEVIKCLPSYNSYYDQVSSLLKSNQCEALSRIHDDTKGFDDLTVIKFKADEGRIFFGIVFDSDALEHDPIVTQVIPISV